MRRIGMRSLVVLASFLTSTAAHADRERSNPPCTCKRPSDLVVERIGKLATQPRDQHAGSVESRLRKTHATHYETCLRDSGVSEAEVIVRYARGAEMPKLRHVGNARVTACFAKLTWYPMIAAPKTVTYRFRVALSSARR